MRACDAKVVVIGAGPAGVAAAIQLKRYGIKPLVFEKDRIGGLLWNANLVENYP
ncbi:MAG TPA: FAD-dependent oxidoreductase, partial [Candidatus Latescibacteria bacterium]|nr:FAD-dependent oxidoreductase [Candidatus Latescibacterota bacterium]